MCFSSDNTQLVSASLDATIKIWDLETGTCIHTLTEHTHSINSLCFTPDNSKLISCSNDQTINIYSEPDLKKIFTLSGLWLLDYILWRKSQGISEKLPLNELYFELYSQLPEFFQKMIIDVFDQDELNKK
jgi:WD40 repeat protein